MGLRLILTGVVGLLLTAAAYFAVQSYRDMAADNEKLKGQVVQLEADAKAKAEAEARINAGLTANQETTTRVIERTREIERQINAQPTTTNCISAPAIRTVLDRLQDSAGQSTSDQVSKRAVPVP